MDADPTVASLPEKIMAIFKNLPKTVKSAFQIEDVATSCRCCKGSVRYPQQFCSQDCVMKYWGSVRLKNGKVSGKFTTAGDRLFSIFLVHRVALNNDYKN